MSPMIVRPTDTSVILVYGCCSIFGSNVNIYLGVVSIEVVLNGFICRYNLTEGVVYSENRIGPSTDP